MGTPSFVRFAGEVATAEVRKAQYAGVEHVVVPIVALRGGIVVTGMLSDGPEYIPPDVLAAAPGGWQGRPCIAYHPDDTANTPETWDTAVFGQAFFADYSDGRLRVEVYLNPKQAERAGEDAVEVIAKALAGELFEVSVGAWVWLVDEEGVSPSGEKYSQRWQSVVPDHIALGLQRHGGKGACSNEMGCGGPRVFSAKQAEEVLSKKEPVVNESLLARLVTKLGEDGIVALAEGMSDSALRQKLNRALRAVVPAFWGVEEVFMDSSSAIYVAMPGDSLEFWECSFTVDGDNVTLGRRKQVEPVTEWKKVAKADDQLEQLEEAQENLIRALAGCKCHEADNGDPAVVGEEPPTQGNKGVTMSDKAPEKVVEKTATEPTAAAVALAGRLIANSAAPFASTPPAVLAALGEEQLTALEAKYTETVPEKLAADPDKVEVSKEELANLRRMAAREEARDKQRRAQLVAALLATGRKGFDEKALNAKSTDELESLAAFAEVETVEPEYAGPGAFALSREAADGDYDHRPVDPWKSNPALVAALGMRAAS